MRQPTTTTIAATITAAGAGTARQENIKNNDSKENSNSHGRYPHRYPLCTALSAKPGQREPLSTYRCSFLGVRSNGRTSPTPRLRRRETGGRQRGRGIFLCLPP